MKHIIALFLALAATVAGQNITSIAATGNGSTINAATDTLLYSAGNSSGNATLRRLSFEQLANIPGLSFSGNASNITSGSLSLSRLAQGGATANQTLTWNGTVWAPATPAASSGNVTNAAVNAAISSNETATLRSSKIIGTQNILPTERRLHKLVLKKRRSNQGLPGAGHVTSRGVNLALGDSIAADIGPELWTRWGFGGTNRANAVTYSGTGITLQGALANPIVNVYDRTPTGAFVTMNATSGGNITYDVSGPLSGLAFSYLSSNSTGKMRVLVQTNKTGSYVPITNTWDIEKLKRRAMIANGSKYVTVAKNFGLETGMVVTGTGISANTTIVSMGYTGNLTKTVTMSANSTTASMADVSGISLGMQTVSGIGGYVTAINTLGNSITMSGAAGVGGYSGAAVFSGYWLELSNAATVNNNLADLTFTRVNAGSNEASGVLNTNNGGAEKYCTASIELPSDNPDFYNVRIEATEGNVHIVSAHFDAGGLNIEKTSAYQKTGWYSVNMSMGGRRVDEEFKLTTQDVWNRCIGWLDPDIITFRSLNDWSIEKLVTTGAWEQFMGRLKAAAPFATIVVGGAHHHGGAGLSGRDDGYALVDDWVREWCAANDVLFVDIISNLPAFSTEFGSLDSIWSDGLHLYDNADSWTGGGNKFVNLLMFEKVQPALESIYSLATETNDRNSVRPIPGNPNRIRMYGNYGSGSTQLLEENFMFEGPPRKSLSVTANHLGTETVTTGSTASRGAGFKSCYVGNANSSALSLVAGGEAMMTFGQYASAPTGFAVGIAKSDIPNSAGGRHNRAADGYRLNVQSQFYTYNGLIMETRSSMTSGGRVIGININSTDDSEGTSLMSWSVGNATVSPKFTYHGRTNDANITEYTHDEPVAVSTIHTPVNATAGNGTFSRVIGVIPSYGNATIGEAAVGQWEVYYDEATKKVKVDPN